jgi:signal transduction histidine kinase
VVIFNQDRELRYTWINTPVLSCAKQDYLGRTDEEIVGGTEGQKLMELKRAVVDSGVGIRSEAVVTLKGERHYYDVTAEPMRDSAGSIQGITCCATDITPVKRAAAERERLLDELAQAHAELVARNIEVERLHSEKTRWLGMANHDLLHPLSTILANCELLLDETPTWRPDDTATVEAICSSGEFMLQLLNEVRDISVIEAGNQHLRPVPTDVRSLAETSIAQCRPFAARKGLQIAARYQQPIPVVSIDPRKYGRYSRA